MVALYLLFAVFFFVLRSRPSLAVAVDVVGLLGLEAGFRLTVTVSLACVVFPSLPRAMCHVLGSL